MPRPGSNARGFTLLELIAVLVVAGFIGLGLADATRFGVAAWEHETKLSARNEDLDATDRLIRRLIEQMEYSVRQVPGEKTEGSATRFAFLSRLPLGASQPLMRRADILLAAEPDGPGFRLVMISRPQLKWLPPAPPPDRAILVRGLSAVAFSYWRENPDGTGGWVESWTIPDLPKLVRLRLSFPAATRRVWPDIVAAPHRDAPKL